jgi:hypothetical protein
MHVALKRRVQTEWAFATIDELKQRRTEALGRAAQAEGDAVEPRRQAEMYTRAATELSTRAAAFEAYAKASEANGDVKAARKRRQMAADLVELSAKNWLMADGRARQAMQLEGRAHQETALARRLALEIKSRTASFVE